MNNMFSNCNSLEYINLNNFDENKLKSCNNMFYRIPENVVICINQNITKDKIFIELETKKCLVIDCSTDYKSKQKKLVTNNDVIQCLENYDESPQNNESNTENRYEYTENFYENCSNGYLYDDNNRTLNICKCQLDKCLICSQEALNKNLCNKCNTNYYPKENDDLNSSEYFNCYQEPEGYYLDNSLYKKCFYTCKTCSKEGNSLIHNCNQCNDNFSLIIKKENFYNCYDNCIYYHYFDNENIFHCTKNFTCPEEFPKLIKSKMECVKYSLREIIQIILNNERSEMEKSKEKEIEVYDYILKIIEEELISNNYDTSILDFGEDDIIEAEKLIITFTTTKNQRNNLINNMTRIDLGICENILRKFYNLTSNETLYMKKIDIVQEGMKTLKVEYDVYAKRFGNNLINLNLTLCGENKISIFIPKVITENLDKFNSSSGYYNDICYSATSEYKTDISLKDRQKEFIDKDRIICQENCNFSDYNYKTFFAKCTCKVKEFARSFSDMNINKAKLLNKFKNIKNNVNYKFLVCYKKLFNKKGISNNIGCYIIFFIILFHVIAIFIFCINKFSKLEVKIKRFAVEKYEYQKIKKNEKYNKKEKIVLSNISQFNSKKISIYKNLSKKNKPLNNKKQLGESLMKINSKVIKYNKDNNVNIKNYIDEEINVFSYKMAILYDKRTYCQYYASLLRTQHNLICALFNNKDYNSGIIKIDLFFIGFAIDYTVNALFYNDNTMHEIYESQGDFDLETQIIIAVCSTIISMLLNFPLNSLALTNDAIINFKQINTKKINILKKAKELRNIFIIKFALYFIISFLLLLFIWYYISMFGVIFRNTQIYLLKDTIMSFVFSLIIPFVIYLFPGIFRIPSLSNNKRKRECLYKISKFLQSF